MNNKFGGNVLRHIDLKQDGRQEFALHAPYVYYGYKCTEDTDFSIEDVQSFTVYVLEKEDAVQVKVEAEDFVLNQGDMIQVENRSVSLHVVGGVARFLIAGVTSRHFDTPQLSLTRFENLYKVNKHWGHELWINGKHSGYCLKQISICSGTKTSLQYHRQKQETNILFEGESRLHFKKTDLVSNDNVQPEDIGTVDLKPVTAIDVIPLTLHRLEAVSDILLYEVSTPHLDDVVRIQDDSNRPDGRIQSEHTVIQEAC